MAELGKVGARSGSVAELEQAEQSCREYRQARVSQETCNIRTWSASAGKCSEVAAATCAERLPKQM